jgi:CII-binding regulator of phage lambda lysogenization HflD
MTDQKTRKLEDVVREHIEILEEIEALKEQVQTADSNADRAHGRISVLEKRMDEIGDQISTMSRDINDVKSEVRSFGPRQELFLQNTWRLIFNLVILFGGFIIILGGLVGVKIAFPILFQ